MDGEENFMASDGWIDRQKKKYGIRQLNTAKKLCVNSSKVTDFQSKFKELILQYGFTSDLFNCDKIGFNYKMLPTIKFAARHEKSVLEF